MTNLETMEKGVDFTRKAYVNYYAGKIDPEDVSRGADQYSAEALYKVLTSETGMCSSYTRKGNLRYDMAGLGKDAIKNELLKNIVNVATYHISSNTIPGRELGDSFRDNMNCDQVAVVLFNNVAQYGAQKGYELLNDSNILFNACVSFARYRSSEKRDVMDQIGRINNGAIYVHHELDVYYARYGDRQDVSDMAGFSYLEEAGFGSKK